MPLESPLFETICVITPSLPPAIDGLGDFCKELWDRLGSGPEGGWTFVVLAGARASQSHFPGTQVSESAAGSESLLAALLASGARTVFLQYVGYGYDRSSRPFWLVEALKLWKERVAGSRLVVMFHETWASGPIWSPVFWQQSGQRRCAGEVLELADAAVTSNMATLRDLTSLKPGKEIKLIPLGASFPNIPPTAKDWRRLVIVGREGSRARALSVHRPLIRRLAETDVVEAIVLAGECSAGVAPREKRFISSLGFKGEILSAYNFHRESIPCEVLSSGLSLMHAESTCLLKSTSFHLAASSGQVPIAVQTTDPGEPVELDRHYLGYSKGEPGTLVDKLRNPEVLGEISRNLTTLASERFAWTRLADCWREVLSAPTR